MAQCTNNINWNDKIVADMNTMKRVVDKVAAAKKPALKKAVTKVAVKQSEINESAPIIQPSEKKEID